jgi:hypothetical protein
VFGFSVDVGFADGVGTIFGSLAGAALAAIANIASTAALARVRRFAQRFMRNAVERKRMARNRHGTCRPCARRRDPSGDRLFFIQLYRWFPSILQVLQIIRPEMMVRWHRAGFRSYWRWKSRKRGGRPQISPDLGSLLREMSRDNPLWGAPRIHGELLKLGFETHSNEARTSHDLAQPI